MTVAALIEIVLRRIAEDFYSDRQREYLRDRNELKRAIARYGFECNSRAWDFSADDICKDLIALLSQIERQKADIHYLPRYLEGAVDRNIRYRADELNARAKKITTIAQKAIGNVKPAEVREATAVEILDKFYRDQKQRMKRRKKIAAAVPKNSTEGFAMTSRKLSARPTFERFFLIIKHLKINQPVSQDFLAKKLEVTRRTIHRDLDFLIDRMELPIGRSHKGVVLLMPIKLCPTCMKQLTDD